MTSQLKNSFKLFSAHCLLQCRSIIITAFIISKQILKISYQLGDIQAYDLNYWHDYNGCIRPLQPPPQPENGGCLHREVLLQVQMLPGINFASNSNCNQARPDRQSQTRLFVIVFLVSYIWLYDFGTKPRKFKKKNSISSSFF